MCLLKTQNSDRLKVIMRHNLKSEGIMCHSAGLLIPIDKML
jgi:hypothetical protein